MRPTEDVASSRARALARHAGAVKAPRERAAAWTVAADAFLEAGRPRSAADALIRATEARAVHSCRWGHYCPILTMRHAARIAQLDDRILRGQNVTALGLLAALTHWPRGVVRTTSLLDFHALLRTAVARLEREV